MKKIIWIGVISIICCFSLTACSLKPTYYSDKEVKQYVEDVFGDEYQLMEKREYPNAELEDTIIYEYVFEDEEGFGFTVISDTDYILYMGDETLFYEKKISDDYIKQKVATKKDAIANALQEVSFDYQDQETSLLCDIEDYTQIIDVANLMVNLDSILELKYDYTNWNEGRINPTYSISVSMKPNAEEYRQIDEAVWKKDSGCIIYTGNLSYSSNERLEITRIEEDIQRSLVYKIQSSQGDFAEMYDVPEELQYKFPPQFLRLDIGKEFEYEYTFTCNEEDNTYWIHNLDPCQNFEGVYNYTEQGAFDALVEMLGGTYECDEWEATWKIGEHTWKAVLKVDEDLEFQEFIVKKDGVRLVLDEPNNQNNGTVSGRAFSMEDIEKLLNVRMIENKKEALVYMEKIR